MEASFDLAALLGGAGREGPFVALVDERVLRSDVKGQLCALLEEMGKKSAVAQGLRKPVTFGSAAMLGNQRIYILVDGNFALGFLKVGTKKLFVAPSARCMPVYADVQGAFREIEPLCALDFYVHERCQRMGCGLTIFEGMLSREGAHPARLGYDRPSPKLLAFLAKHHGLVKFQPQNNNFVVFDDYWNANLERPEREPRRPPGAQSPIKDRGSPVALKSCSLASSQTASGAVNQSRAAPGSTGRGPRDFFNGVSDYRHAQAATIF